MTACADRNLGDISGDSNTFLSARPLSGGPKEQNRYTADTSLSQDVVKFRLLATRTLLAVLLLAWSGPLTAHDSPDLISLKRQVISDYAAIACANYEDALAAARTLAESVETFLLTPNADSLTRARQAWIDARIPYAQTEAFRFYDGPIDALDGLINSWPIDENLIDYVDGEPDAGIVNHAEMFPAITDTLITSLNEKDGEKNITAGFHAIEFLLWGQDVNDDGPGNRSFADYVGEWSPHANRRREYLHVATSLLVQHLTTVLQEWAPDKPSNYRARFLAMPSDEALANILKGVGILSGAELAGERLTVAYETKEQEDEHSCFSDNTQQDIVYNTLGIENVIVGRYVRVSGERIAGHGFRELLSRAAPTLADALVTQLAASVAAARAVPAPFDQAIAGTDSAPSRVAVKHLITALRAQADSIAQAGKVLGLKLNF
jgi:putative iron-regulated protein